MEYLSPEGKHKFLLLNRVNLSILKGIHSQILSYKKLTISISVSTLHRVGDSI